VKCTSGGRECSATVRCASRRARHLPFVEIEAASLSTLPLIQMANPASSELPPDSKSVKYPANRHARTAGTLPNSVVSFRFF
jgi:hypothetical protein